MTAARPHRAAFAAALAFGLLAGCATPSAPVDRGTFFDDFSEPDLAGLAAAGWTVRTAAGHPGIPGAAWATGAVALVADPADPSNRLLRLTARTDGTPSGTVQAQLCHARKYFEGTYAARVRFSDLPRNGPAADVPVQAFYAVAPLQFDLDPSYSEIDWEYLPRGGWGDPRTRLYGVTWQTARLDPWLAVNAAHQSFGSFSGWHVLLMQVGGGRVALYVDGRRLAEHGGRNYPVVPMAISFSEWFSPGGRPPATAGESAWQQEVDWVFHARDRLLAPAEVEAAVDAFRRRGVSRSDTVAPADPPLPSPCDL